MYHIVDKRYKKKGNKVYQKSNKKRHRKMKATEKFRCKIKHLMIESGLSPREIGLKAGLSHNTIYRILSEKNDPTLDTSDAIARALGVSLAEILGEPTKDHTLEECYRRVHRDRPSQRSKKNE